MSLSRIPVIVALLFITCNRLPTATIRTGIPDGPPPAIPDRPDPAVTISCPKSWYQVGTGTLAGTVAIDNVSHYVDIWIDTTPMVRYFQPGTTVEFTGDLSEFPCGPHIILVGYDGKSTAAAVDTFYITSPLYVSVTSDWEDPFHPDTLLELQRSLHEQHQGLCITHFFGPYTFTDNTSATQRQDIITVDWLLSMEREYGDEIGVHIHPWCHFVEYAGVTCKDTPTFYLPDSRDTTGYGVMLSSFTPHETALMLTATATLFRKNGLPVPVSFRAGGWCADTATLHVLAEYGYIADCSTVNRYALEGHEILQIFTFQEENWPEINGTSQPFIIKAPGGRTLVEVPDNGVLVDYVTIEDMERLFQELWTGDALVKPKVFSIGYHATNISNYVLFQRIDGILDLLDSFRLADGNGPVVYETVRNIAIQWTSD